MAIIVKAKPGDSTNKVIRKFKKKVQKNQILARIRDNQFHKKDSEIKKEKLAEKRRKSRRR